MAWYKTGTVSVTNNSATVTGSGTNFVSGAQVGFGFQGPNGLVYEITAINSSTSLTITPVYGGSTASGQSYAIVPTQGLTAALASDVTDLITDYQTVADNAGAGKFGDGSAASPGIRFVNDQDTGFFKDTANEIAVSVGGSKVGEFTSTGIDGTVIGGTTAAAITATTFTGNRSGTDGDIAVFQKDGTTVGGIRSISGDSIGIGNGVSGLRFVSGTNRIQPVNMTNGLNSDGLTDLGDTNKRFQDLYLSGGVYLGGTGSANLLSSYEEGTWTPTLENGTLTYNIQKGYYTKVGNLVTVSCNVGWTSRSGSGALIVLGLPYTPINDANGYRGGGSLGSISGVNRPAGHQMTVVIDANLAKLFVRYFVDNATWVGANAGDLSASGEIQITASFLAQ